MEYDHYMYFNGFDSLYGIYLQVNNVPPQNLLPVSSMECLIHRNYWQLLPIYDLRLLTRQGAMALPLPQWNKLPWSGMPINQGNC